MGFFDSIAEFFRKKEFYTCKYENLNNYSIEFNILDINTLNQISEVILNFEEAKNLSDSKNMLFGKDAFCFTELQDCVNKVKEVVGQDYRETYFEAIENLWSFNYFLSSIQELYPETILILNKLSSSTDEKMGDVIYNVLAIKKYRNDYFLWNLLG